ncbi:NADH-ubiquinone oxidoreductase-F iron-sulfur binding region domain-containing protein [Burkholderia ubonensis]|uniref:NADH-ubiquinone oxidoreductase-F iron-sulfur binding region domain-containing protein n=1 Tax=Burkholderia ubonensis TaxID=101571 RepID=UPI00075289F9|nr:NADH-ubiquinone oxidoreductase-F iron-sulfur binding region domain-containing protein [Burkholderia ubonensis]KVA14312.1 NADH dehydrogenase [Burkholderia ubonensis]KVA26873.1 NADH dehydrogenase [Burkholderia ubonensis]KVA34861.1 NADH dehydrogenase [Burkholderia ubonensis]
MRSQVQQLRRHAAAHSFYHLGQSAITDCACAGLACFAARADRPRIWQSAIDQRPIVSCLGKCYDGPSDGAHDVRPNIVSHGRRTVLLGSVLIGGVRDLNAYREHGGGSALANAQATAPDALIQMLHESGLRGRGGAGFPAAIKWQAVANECADPKYLVVNADEGDPGAFSDRFLLEDDPFRVIEGAAIAACAVGARRGFIYLRKEYPSAAQIVSQALRQARAAGWLSEGFDLQLIVGQGAYICGEETSLLNALEGRRPEARQRPPQITRHGLFGAPTLVHNVETLCAVPWIVTHGAAAYAELGFSRSRGTKLLSLSSLFCRPGLYEVEFGISLADIVDHLGQGLRRGALKGLMVGGPLAGIVPPELLETRLGYEEMRAIDCAVGHGGVIAFSDDTSIMDIVAEVFRFGARESCGACTPCHFGTPALAAMADAALAGASIDGVRYRQIVDALAATSLCGHGRGLAEFAQSVRRHYAAELKPWLG